jgi:hypothetical protein
MVQPELEWMQRGGERVCQTRENLHLTKLDGRQSLSHFVDFCRPQAPLQPEAATGGWRCFVSYSEQAKVLRYVSFLS